MFLFDSLVSLMADAYPPAILKNHSVPVLHSSPKAPKRVGRPSLPGYGYKLIRRLDDRLPYMEGHCAMDLSLQFKLGSVGGLERVFLLLPAKDEFEKQ